MKQTYKKQGVFFSAVLAWVLSLLLVLLSVVGVVALTICNKGYLQQQVLKSGYSAQALENLKENYTSYGSAGGMSSEVMTSFITAEQIQQDLFRSIDEFYKGNREKLQHPEVGQAAKVAMAASLEERGIKITDEIDSALEQMAQLCQTDYENYVRISLASLVAAYMPKLTKLAWVAAGVVAGVTLIALILVLNVQRTAPARLRWCINAFSGAALFCVLVPILFRIFVKMENLRLSPASFKNLLVSYTNSMVNVFFYFGLIYALVVVAMALAWRAAFNRNKQAYQARKAMEY